MAFGREPVFEPKNRYHPFDGDGMVHALHISDDGARYVNRWIDTPAFSDEATAGEFGLLRALWGLLITAFPSLESKTRRTPIFSH